MRSKGRITSWSDDRGYGFITPLSGGRRTFVHITAFVDRARRPEVGQVVTYVPSTDRRGRPCATRATLAGAGAKHAAPRPNGRPALVAGLVFFTLIVSVAAAGRLPVAVPVAYLVLSLLTFIAYAMDKMAARNGTWRTAESSLHLLAVAGGWPGAWVAQQRLRHKSSKRSFRTVFWITVVLNLGLLLWLATPYGSHAWRAIRGAVL